MKTMGILVVTALVILQTAGVCYALFLFARSISGFTRNETKRVTGNFINALLISILLGLVIYLVMAQ